MLGAYLTEPRGGSWKQALSATVPGMAYFAKTGPDCAVCRQCKHWGGRKRVRDAEGYLKPARCRRYRLMRRGQGLPPVRDGVPPETPACKYFQNHPRPPQLRREPTREE